MQTFISFIVVFGLVVLFHEFGHFIVAKLGGIKINEFAIGMGPKILKYQGKETLYSLRAFPIGGFVSMEGEGEESEDTRSFQKKNPLLRFAVVAAGPIMNFVLAIILFMALALYSGMPSTTIGKLIDNMPAKAAGIMVGDEVKSINGTPISEWNDLTKIVGESNGKPLVFTVKRADSIQEIEVIPTFDANENRYMIGINYLSKHSILASFAYGFETTGKVTQMIVEYLPKLFQGNNFANDVVGPVGIVVMIGEASRNGLANVIGLAALISINLGLMNLLPIPALDGGRLLFLTIELILRKPVKEEWEANIHRLGFVLLIGLTIVIFVKDIFKFWQ
jgi:regulator of sigma E protease